MFCLYLDLKIPSAVIISQGARAVVQYMKTAEKKGTQNIYRCKLMIVNKKNCKCFILNRLAKKE